MKPNTKPVRKKWEIKYGLAFFEGRKKVKEIEITKKEMDMFLLGFDLSSQP